MKLLYWKRHLVYDSYSRLLDDEFINTYWADGLIISGLPVQQATLSCGGPIVLPGTNNFIITPIAPHNLNVRPIIVSDESKIT